MKWGTHPPRLLIWGRTWGRGREEWEMRWVLFVATQEGPIWLGTSSNRIISQGQFVKTSQNGDLLLAPGGWFAGTHNQQSCFVPRCRDFGECEFFCTKQNRATNDLQVPATSLQSPTAFEEHLNSLPEKEALALRLQAFRSIQCVYCAKPFSTENAGTCTPVANQSTRLIDYEQSLYLGWKAGTYDLFGEADREADPDLANCAYMQVCPHV